MEEEKVEEREEGRVFLTESLALRRFLEGELGFLEEEEDERMVVKKRRERRGRGRWCRRREKDGIGEEF